MFTRGKNLPGFTTQRSSSTQRSGKTLFDRLKLLARCTRGWRGGAFVTLICLAVYVPGLFSLPVVDRDEARFAQASRQMFESVALPDDAKRSPDHDGGLAIPMLQDKPRLNKPPMIYWLQSASAAILTVGDPSRDAIWMYRIPSVLAAIGVSLLTWHLGRRMYTDLVGVLAGWIIAVAPVFAWEATQARADMALVFVTLASMVLLWRVVERTTRKRDESSLVHTQSMWRCPLDVAAMWILISLGILTKGPITPMVFGLSVVSLALMDRRMRIMRAVKPVHGVIIVVLMLTPWVTMVSQQYGLKNYIDLVMHETVGRSASSREGHWGPPGYHTLLQTVLMWPGSLVTYLSVWWFWKLGKPTKAHSDSVDLRARFLLAWLLPSWIVFELVATKLPHYTMPMYPALAIISARGILGAAGGKLGNMLSPVRVVAVVVWFGIGLVVLIGPSVAIDKTGVLDFASEEVFVRSVSILGFVCIAAICAILLGSWAWFTRRFVRTLLVSLIVVSIAMPLLTSLVFPLAMGLSTDLRELIDDLDPTGLRPVAGVGYHEDSMVFLTRGRYERLSQDDMFNWMEAHEDGVLVVSVDTADKETPPRMQEYMWFGSGTIGFNYTNGKELTLLVMHYDPGFIDRMDRLKQELGSQP